MNELNELLFLENQLCFPLYATSRLTTRVYSPYLKAIDLSYPQYLVMMLLWEEDNIPIQRISERLYLDSNTLSPLLQRMESKGLIHKKKNPQDERSRVIVLSPKGKALKSEAIKIPMQIIGAFQGSNLDAEELKQFQKTLFRLLNALSKKVSL